MGTRRDEWTDSSATGRASARRTPGGERPTHGERNAQRQLRLLTSVGGPASGDASAITSPIRTRAPARAPLAARVHHAVEAEKARIARDLHDEVLQILFALKLDCEWLGRNVHQQPRAALQRVRHMQDMLDSSAQSVRRIAVGLRPPRLDSGLAASLQTLAGEFTGRTGVQCEARINTALQLREADACAVFRIVQEALHNVAKHACATQVLVSLDQCDASIQVTVEDNGKGGAGDCGRPDAMGLAGMRERAALLGGKLTVLSLPGSGTTIKVRVPLPEISWNSPSGEEQHARG